MGSRDIWLFFFFVGVLLFNWPLLGVFEGSLSYYLFAAWGLFIGVIGAVTFRARKKKKQAG